MKVLLKYLINNLKNPDETWTKEKILQHIEDAMSTLEKNNEIKLLNKFLRKLRRDKQISKTLMKCGEDFVALLFSFKQRHNARNVILSEGSLCVTFCFVNDLNLETFMRKIANNDDQLTKDLSRIILNKTLLSIFNIDPQLVWWTASTAKVYLGSSFTFALNIYIYTDMYHHQICLKNKVFLLMNIIFAKPFKGLQCFETVFSKPIEGCPEDFTTNRKGKY